MVYVAGTRINVPYVLGAIMADDKSDLFKEFEEFLSAKAQREKDEQQAEDFEVEIWDEKGRGVRTRRSHAKPFLQSLGLDPDEPTESNDDSGSGDAGKGDKSKSGKPRSTPAGSQSVARKYFVKQTK